MARFMLVAVVMLVSGLIVAGRGQVQSAAPEAEMALPTEPYLDGKPLTHWMRQLKAETAEDRRRASQLIGRLGRRALPALPALMDSLTDFDAESRWSAVDAIEKIGPAAKDAIPALLTSCKDPDPNIRVHAAKAVWKIDPKQSKAVLSTAMELLSAEFPPGLAYHLVREIGDEAIPVLAVGLRSENKELTSRCNSLLAELKMAAVPRYLMLLKDESPRIRTMAAWGIGRIGLEAQPAATELLPLLKDPSETVQLEVMRAIIAVDPEAAAKLLPTMKDWLKNKEKNVRIDAAKMFASLGAKAKPAADALLAALKDEEFQVRWNAGLTLCKIDAKHGEAVLPVALAAIKNQDEDQRTSGALLFVHLGTAAKSAVTDLAALLDDPDIHVVHLSVHALMNLGPLAKEAAPALVKKLEGADGHGMESICEVLFKIGGPEAKTAARHLLRSNIREGGRKKVDAFSHFKHEYAPKMVPELIAFLKDEDPRVRGRAAQALAQSGSKEKALIPALEKMLKDEDLFARTNAALALCALDTAKGKAAIPVLIEVLKTNDEMARGTAYQAAAQLKKYPVEAIPRLIAAFETDDDLARLNIIGTLTEMDPDCISPLCKALTNKSLRIRSGAVHTLHLLARHAKPAVPSLLEVLKVAEIDLRISILRALLAIGAAESKSAVPVLAELAKDQDGKTRICALQLLTQFGPAAKDAVPALCAGLKNDDETTRVESAIALHAVDPTQAKAYVPVLMRAFEDSPNHDVRSRIAATLGDAGEEAKVALPLLVEGLKTANQNQVTACAEAVHRLDRTNSNEAIKALVTMLENHRQPWDIRVLAVLGRMGGDAKPALPFLFTLLLDHTSDHPVAAAEAVLKIDPKLSNEVVVRLCQLLQPEEFDDCDEVLEFLNRQAPHLTASVPTLVETVRETDNGDVRRGLLKLLGGMGDAAKDAVPFLVELTKDKMLGVQKEVLEALKKIDPDAAAKAEMK